MSDYGDFKRVQMEREMEYAEREWKALNRLNRRRSWWTRRSEEVGFILWVFAILLGGSALWLALNGVEKWFR